MSGMNIACWGCLFPQQGISSCTVFSVYVSTGGEQSCKLPLVNYNLVNYKEDEVSCPSHNL